MMLMTRAAAVLKRRSSLLPSPSSRKRAPRWACESGQSCAIAATAASMRIRRAAPSAVVVNSKLPATNMKELIALAKKQPGKLNYGSAGVGSSGHLAVALFEHVANVKLTHVPYKGGGPSVAATIAGEVDLAIPVLASAASHVKAGRLRMLAVTSARRSQAVPDVPTAQEAGVPGYVFETWFGLFAPAGTPKAIVTRLNQATVKALGMKEVREQLASQGVEADSSTPAELAKILRDETETWAKVIKSAGIPIN